MDPNSPSRVTFTQIAQALWADVGVDLGEYGHHAIQHALACRLRAHGLASFEAYAQRMADDAVEPRRLARVLLAADGDLFLDEAAAAVLGAQLTSILARGEQPVLWVPECGEGEEVYALAIRLHQLLSALQPVPAFVVHGSEVDVGALQLARAGVLSPDFAAQIPSALKPHLVVSLAQGTEVQPALMQRCRFHQQVLLAPAPDAVVDLLSGRNLLRFLSEDERRQLLLHWHGALKPGGLLLLGPGESVEGHADLFAPQPLAPGVFRRLPLPLAAPAAAAPLPPSVATAEISIYQRAFLASPRPSALLDADGYLLDLNRAFAQCLHATPAALQGLRLQTLCAEPDQALIDEALAPARRNAPAVAHITLPVTLRDAQPMRLHLNLLNTPSIRAQAELESIEAAPVATQSAVGLQAALAVMSEGLILCDQHGRIQSLNPVAQQLAGWQGRDAVGQLVNEVLQVISPTGEALHTLLAECLHSGTAVEMSGQQAQLVGRDGRRLAIDLRVSPVPMADGSTGAVLLFEDVSQRLLLAEEITWRSTHDPITGLLNREAFERSLRSALLQARHNGEGAVVCLIDIDQFRLVNDVLGYAAGDELLHELAGELRVRLREVDVLARLSGDEFGVLLPGYRLQDAEGVVQSLIEAVRQYRFEWLNRKHAVTISVGVAQIDSKADDVGLALALADAACYAAKGAGRDRASFMGRDDEAALHHRQMGMVGLLGRAIEEGRLMLLCEDVVSVIEPQQVVYRELLVRLRDEEGNWVKPAHFVPAAERYFLMSALDRWVAHEAFSKLATLPADAHRDIIYAINISAQSLSDPDFLEFIRSEIKTTGVDPTRLCFELTETAVVSRLTDAAHFVASLTALGCRFALDDFGVGMSSFGYLKNFPVHFLKIDGSFVRSMRDSQMDRGMVETINRIGQQLGLKTIAEHVESLDLLEPLRAIGVDWAQGHGIAPAHALDELLK